MFCKYCGNQFGEKDLFCAKCGAKKDENIQMKSTSPSSNGIENTNSHKKNIFLSNKMVLLLFIISYILVFFVEVQAIAETNFPSGFILLFVPFIAAFKGVPQFVGIILSINNCHFCFWIDFFIRDIRNHYGTKEKPLGLA